MQKNTVTNRGNVGVKAGMLSSAFQAANEAGIDPATLSQLDVALVQELAKNRPSQGAHLFCVMPELRRV